MKKLLVRSVENQGFSNLDRSEIALLILVDLVEEFLRKEVGMSEENENEKVRSAEERTASPEIPTEVDPGSAPVEPGLRVTDDGEPVSTVKKRVGRPKRKPDLDQS